MGLVGARRARRSKFLLDWAKFDKKDETFCATRRNPGSSGPSARARLSAPGCVWMGKIFFYRRHLLYCVDDSGLIRACRCSSGSLPQVMPCWSKAMYYKRDFLSRGGRLGSLGLVSACWACRCRLCPDGTQQQGLTARARCQGALPRLTARARPTGLTARAHWPGLTGKC